MIEMVILTFQNMHSKSTFKLCYFKFILIETTIWKKKKKYLFNEKWGENSLTGNRLSIHIESIQCIPTMCNSLGMWFTSQTDIFLPASQFSLFRQISKVSMNMWIEWIAVANILRLGGRGNTNSRINSLDVRKKYTKFFNWF